MDAKTPSTGERTGSPSPRLPKSCTSRAPAATSLFSGASLPAVRIGERSIRVNRTELERFLLRTGE